MSSPLFHLPLEHAKDGMILAHDPVDAEARQFALRLHLRERLRRLFSHIGDSADDHSLLGIERRYRGIDLSSPRSGLRKSCDVTAHDGLIPAATLFTSKDTLVRLVFGILISI